MIIVEKRSLLSTLTHLWVSETLITLHEFANVRVDTNVFYLAIFYFTCYVLGVFKNLCSLSPSADIKKYFEVIYLIE